MRLAMDSMWFCMKVGDSFKYCLGLGCGLSVVLRFRLKLVGFMGFLWLFFMEV